MEHKQCTKCLETKPVEGFHARPKSRSGYRSRCKVCTNEENLAAYTEGRSTGAHRKAHITYTLKKYGLTEETYFAMLALQGGACAICGTSIKPMGSGAPRNELACIDHDHGTGATRSLLCWHCNAGLGHFGDNPQTMARGAAYLEEHRNGT